MKKKHNKMYNEWSLDVFYKGADDPAIEADLKKIEEIVGEYKTAVAELDASAPAASLRRVIDIKEGTTEYETEVIKYLDFYSDDEAAFDRFEFNGNEFSFIEQVAAFFKYIFVKSHRIIYWLNWL